MASVFLLVEEKMEFFYQEYVYIPQLSSIKAYDTREDAEYVKTSKEKSLGEVTPNTDYPRWFIKEVHIQSSAVPETVPTRMCTCGSNLPWEKCGVSQY